MATVLTGLLLKIDNNAQLGILMKGTLWKRPTDNFGIAMAINGLSSLQKEYLELGGYGFIIGDGSLNYRPEFILEAFYNAQIANFLFISPDYQFIANPGYNRDRGPVHVLRLESLPGNLKIYYCTGKPLFLATMNIEVLNIGTDVVLFLKMFLIKNLLRAPSFKTSIGAVMYFISKISNPESSSSFFILGIV